MDGSFFELICASRLPRITAQMWPLELITVALVKSMLVFIPIDMYILYQQRRGTFQKHPRISWSRKSSCFAPGVI